MKRLVAILVFSILVLGCNKTNTETRTETVPALNKREVPVFEWEDNFNGSIADYWAQQLVESERGKIVEDPLNPDNEVLKLSLKPGDFTRGGHRSELVIRDYDSIGYTNEYEFRFMLPDEFFSDNELGSWVIIHQWHDDTAPGYTWQTNKHKTRPPIALAVHYSPERGYILHYKSGLETGNLEEVVGLVWPGELKANTWYTFKNTVFWSLYNEHGYSLPLINNAPFNPDHEKVSADFKILGRNAYNAKGNFFKFGLYHSGREEHTRVMYLDDFKMTAKRTSYWHN